LSHSYTIVFGLTADPIHLGHEQAIINGIDYCRDQRLEVDQFLLMPVYQPNLIAGKKGPVANFQQRFDMCDIVAKRLSKKLDCEIETSLIEKQFAKTSGEKSYSFNTIKYMTEIETEPKPTKLLFMVSADHFQGRWPKFRKWFKWQELLNYTGLLINQRPGHKININFTHQLKEINNDVFVIRNSQSVAISSSEIRDSNDLSKLKFLSKDVERYVLKADLYGKKKGL
jgi:nicotinate (nicotinamide) nucleotide adenylyltransferase